MSSLKRSRLDDDVLNNDDRKEQRLAPKDFNFNFVPTIQPHQKMFDFNQSLDTSVRPTDLGPNTLTHRFIARSQRFWVESKKPESKANSVSIIKPSSYEPTYLRHRDISYTVIIYVQMAFNILVTTTIVYIFANFVLAIRQDFRIKAIEHAEALHQQKMLCTNNYIINQCGDDDRIPAIEDLCNEWASCMNKDIVVAQAKVSAEAIADIINSFVEPISYKALLFVSVLILGTIIASNVAFSVFKRNHKPPVLAIQ